MKKNFKKKINGALKVHEFEEPNLDSDSVFLDSVGAINSDLIVGLITLLNGQIIEVKIVTKIYSNSLYVKTQEYILPMYGRINFSLIKSQMMRVISSPWISTTGPHWIFGIFQSKIRSLQVIFNTKSLLENILISSCKT